MTQPAQQSVKNFAEGFGFKGADPVEGANGRKGRHALNQERSGLQEGNAYAISKGEPRKLVVWGTTVMRERSWSPKGTLTTSAGRVLPARPKSISQTSPRRGVGLFSLEGFKQSGRSSADLFIRERAGIEGQCAAQYLLGEGAFLLRRQLFEGFQQGLSLVAHDAILAGPSRMIKDIITWIAGQLFARRPTSAHR